MKCSYTEGRPYLTAEGEGGEGGEKGVKGRERGGEGEREIERM
jgi:hypothetical protein